MTGEASYMREAIAEAYRGIRRGDGGPFGAVIVRDGEILARGHNEVLRSNDPTRHAEMCAISRVARKLGSPHFTGCDIYSTTEPCVMCFAAVHWAQIARVYYGTGIRDVARLGFNELSVSNRRLKTLGGSPVELTPGFLVDECLKLLSDWAELPERRVY